LLDAARVLRRTVLIASAALSFGMASAQIIAPTLSSKHYDFGISSLNGVAVHGEARGTDSLDFQPSITVTVTGNRATMHRLFLDRTHRLYFGYDLLVVPDADTGRIHLSFSRLTNLSSFQGINVEGYTPGGHVVPFTEKTLAAGEPLVLQMEIDSHRVTVLQDTLVFGPAQH
jgi:hypothetical protein